MSGTYSRTIEMRDTDAAGVLFTPRLLELAHSVYEEHIGQAGLGLGTLLHGSDLLLPIRHTEASFHQPLTLGDCLIVEVCFRDRGQGHFQSRYTFTREGTRDPAAEASFTHVALSRLTGRRVDPLPAELRALCDC